MTRRDTLFSLLQSRTTSVQKRFHAWFSKVFSLPRRYHCNCSPNSEARCINILLKLSCRTILPWCFQISFKWSEGSGTPHTGFAHSAYDGIWLQYRVRCTSYMEHFRRNSAQSGKNTWSAANIVQFRVELTSTSWYTYINWFLSLQQSRSSNNCILIVKSTSTSQI